MSITVESLLAKINEFRRNPSAYSAMIQKRKAEYKDKSFVDFSGTKFKSQEGVAPVDELLTEMAAWKPQPEVVIDPDIQRCAQRHCDWLCENNKLSHLGDQGSTIGKRVDGIGHWAGKLNELICVQCKTPDDVLVKWLIDDGVEMRDDREALTWAHKKVGIGINPNHKTHGLCIVLLMVEKFGIEGSPDAPHPVENEKIIDELPENLKKIPDGVKSIIVTKRTTRDGEYDKIDYSVKYNMKDGSSKNSNPLSNRQVPKRPWPQAFTPNLPFLAKLAK